MAQKRRKAIITYKSNNKSRTFRLADHYESDDPIIDYSTQAAPIADHEEEDNSMNMNDIESGTVVTDHSADIPQQIRNHTHFHEEEEDDNTIDQYTESDTDTKANLIDIDDSDSDQILPDNEDDVSISATAPLTSEYLESIEQSDLVKLLLHRF
jgi:hypothetical protein